MTLEETIIKLGIMAEEKMQNAKTEEEYAFLFGHVNMAAALGHAIAHKSGAVHISMDYKSALNAYKESKKENETDEEDEYEQISMEELFPILFEALKTASKKKNTPKKPKKE